MKLGAFAAMFALVVGMGSHFAQASGEKFILEAITQVDSSNFRVYFFVNESGTITNETSTVFSASGLNSEDDLRNAEVNAVVTWANGTGGYSGITSNDVIMVLKPKLSTVATSGLFSDIGSKPTTLSGYGITDAGSKSYEGTTAHNNTVTYFNHATVGSGVAIFQLTTDGLSTGTSICSNGVIADSVIPNVSDATASYQMSWAFSNSNKTLTITANKLTTANILTGILGQATANGSVVKISVSCY